MGTMKAAVCLSLATTRSLPWETLGAISEMLQTAWGSLFKSLCLAKGERLLIRGVTTSVGLAAAAIAKNHGALIGATTRRPLRSSGVDQVFIDIGAIAKQVKEEFPSAVDKVLELVDTTTLADSLRCSKQRGIVCITGMMGNKWSFGDFSPMDVIPTSVCLTTYDCGPEDFMLTPLDELVRLLDRDDSPWYPSMRLFRQKVRGDWNSVLERLELKLTTLIPPGNSL